MPWIFKAMKIENIPVVREFKDIFVEELLRLLSQRKINFEIKLIPSAQPLSKAPCLMAPTKLSELKI